MGRTARQGGNQYRRNTEREHRMRTGGQTTQENRQTTQGENREADNTEGEQGRLVENIVSADLRDKKGGPS